MDNSSKIKTKSAQQAFLATGIRFFSFSVDNPENTPILDNLARFRDFRYLAWDSGGFAIRIPSIALGTPKPPDRKDGRLSDQEALFTAQLHQIFYYQRVGIVLREQPEKAREWTLNAKGKKFRDPLVVYPHMLDACAETKTASSAAHGAFQIAANVEAVRGLNYLAGRSFRIAQLDASALRVARARKSFNAQQQPVPPAVLA